MNVEPSTVGLEQPALDYFYRTERSWATMARRLSSGGALLLMASSGYGKPAAIVLIVISIACQLVAWRAMRGAQRLEKRRIERIIQGGGHG